MAEVHSLFDVRTTVVDDVVTVSVRGEVDLANVARVRAALTGLATDPLPRLVVCDLTNVTFLACCAMAVLLDAQQELADGFEVVATNPAVLRPLALTGLSDLLTIRSRPSTVDNRHGVAPRG